MTGADLLIEARRRAGLTQQQLADRLGRPQSTVSRWESGDMEPSFAALKEAVRACELDLDVSIARADDSYSALIKQQRARTPLARVTRSAGEEFEAVLYTLLDANVRFLLAGSHAAAAHGSPVSPSPRTVVVPEGGPRNMRRLKAALATTGTSTTPQDRDVDVAFELPDGTQVLAQCKPAGTRGYRDLARYSERLQLDDREVMIVSVLDLLRIADASSNPEEQLLRPALQKLLELDRPAEAKKVA